MRDAEPKKHTKPQMMRIDGPPKPPTKVTLQLSLNRNIVLLGGVMPKLEGKLLQIVERLLRDIRDYKREFPRIEA